MIVFSREVFVCRCSTDVPRDDPSCSEPARRMRFSQGGEVDLARLDPAHHNPEHVEELRARLRRGEHWLLGADEDGKIVTYTWLHARERIEYPSLPGCAFTIPSDTGYGYDAWTPPALRGQGLRRRAFLEELYVLRSWGKRWEASFFVKHQLEGATRSLGSEGIVIEPLWDVNVLRDKSLVYRELVAGSGVRPAPATTAA